VSISPSFGVDNISTNVKISPPREDVRLQGGSPHHLHHGPPETYARRATMEGGMSDPELSQLAGYHGLLVKGVE